MARTCFFISVERPVSFFKMGRTSLLKESAAASAESLSVMELYQSCTLRTGVS